MMLKTETSYPRYNYWPVYLKSKIHLFINHNYLLICYEKDFKKSYDSFNYHGCILFDWMRSIC
jgi:hypothetical protein